MVTRIGEWPDSLSRLSILLAPALLGLLLCSAAVDATPLACPANHFLKDGACAMCIKCDEGLYVKTACHGTTNTECDICPPHTFKPGLSYEASCRPCTDADSLNCDDDPVKYACSATRDTHCYAYCPSDQYWDGNTCVLCKLAQTCLAQSLSVASQCTPEKNLVCGQSTRVTAPAISSPQPSQQVDSTSASTPTRAVSAGELTPPTSTPTVTHESVQSKVISSSANISVVVEVPLGRDDAGAALPNQADDTGVKDNEIKTVAIAPAVSVVGGILLVLVIVIVVRKRPRRSTGQYQTGESTAKVKSNLRLTPSEHQVSTSTINSQGDSSAKSTPADRISVESVEDRRRVDVMMRHDLEIHMLNEADNFQQRVVFPPPSSPGSRKDSEKSETDDQESAMCAPPLAASLYYQPVLDCQPALDYQVVIDDQGVLDDEAGAENQGDTTSVATNTPFPDEDTGERGGAGVVSAGNGHPASTIVFQTDLPEVKRREFHATQEGCPQGNAQETGTHPQLDSQLALPLRSFPLPKTYVPSDSTIAAEPESTSTQSTDAQ
ncbi:uncharacterized protein LOC135808413 [Sycon ciliatum]|uniref:uncharacterized protein LOC135808413 n=1 Tax=Sycon ciliatum TaxID=27933 RepID=UPI0031F708DE